MTPDKYLDKVILVDEQDNPVGEMDKIEAHLGKARLHRAISVFLFRKSKKDPSKIELLIQQRSFKKIVGAHQWANTTCGNVRPTETNQECVFRRLRQELGIAEVKVEKGYAFRYQARCNDQFSENEFDHLYLGWYDGEVKPNPEEIQEHQWLEWKKIIKDINNVPGEKSPWFKIMLADNKLLAVIDNFLK